MVKADAYGAGAVEVAKTLQDHRVDYLAVAVADEGVTLPTLNSIPECTGWASTQSATSTA